MAVLDFDKLSSDKTTTVVIGPSATGVLGITDVYEPTADELNNTGGTSGMQPASQSISWNDWAFGMQASETLNEPSFADSASYEEFGQYNFGGAASFYYPRAYDDNSNLHSIIYDLTDIPGTKLDSATRLDGDTQASVPFADGDLVSVFRTRTAGETNPFTPGESKRRTINFVQNSDFAYYTVVGPHTITALAPASFVAADKGRIRSSQGGRDTTNAMVFTTSDAAVITVSPGGFFEVAGAAATTATVTITDPNTGDTASVTVTVS